MNKVLLTGRLTRDPEMRSLASGKNVTTFTVASNEFIGGGKEKAEYHPVVAWDRLAEIAGRYLGKGQQVAIEGRLQTRSWDDDKGTRLLSSVAHIATCSPSWANPPISPHLVAHWPRLPIRSMAQSGRSCLEMLQARCSGRRTRGPSYSGCLAVQAIGGSCPNDSLRGSGHTMAGSISTPQS